MKSSMGQDEDLMLIAEARSGKLDAFEAIIAKYHGFVKLKASSYFMSEATRTIWCRRVSSG